MKKKLLILVAVAGIGGCASVQLPPEQLERSEASIRSAQEVGALEVPAARLHMQLAKDQTAAAKAMADDGDERATLVLARAQSDGELAIVLAREVSVHKEAEKAAEALKAVQNRETP